MIAWLQIRRTSKTLWKLTIIRNNDLILTNLELDPGFPMSLSLAAKHSLAFFLIVFAVNTIWKLITFKLSWRLAERNIVFLALADNPRITGVPFLITDSA